MMYTLTQVPDLGGVKAVCQQIENSDRNQTYQSGNQIQTSEKDKQSQLHILMQSPGYHHLPGPVTNGSSQKSSFKGLVPGSADYHFAVQASSNHRSAHPQLAGSGTTGSFLMSSSYQNFAHSSTVQASAGYPAANSQSGTTATGFSETALLLQNSAGPASAVLVHSDNSYGMPQDHHVVNPQLSSSGGIGYSEKSASCQVSSAVPTSAVPDNSSKGATHPQLLFSGRASSSETFLSYQKLTHSSTVSSSATKGYNGLLEHHAKHNLLSNFWGTGSSQVSTHSSMALLSTVPSNSPHELSTPQDYCVTQPQLSGSSGNTSSKISPSLQSSTQSSTVSGNLQSGYLLLQNCLQNTKNVNNVHHLPSTQTTNTAQVCHGVPHTGFRRKQTVSTNQDFGYHNSHVFIPSQTDFDTPPKSTNSPYAERTIVSSTCTENVNGNNTEILAPTSFNARKDLIGLPSSQQPIFTSSMQRIATDPNPNISLSRNQVLANSSSQGEPSNRGHVLKAVAVVSPLKVLLAEEKISPEILKPINGGCSADITSMKKSQTSTEGKDYDDHNVAHSEAVRNVEKESSSSIPNEDGDALLDLVNKGCKKLEWYFDKPVQKMSFRELSAWAEGLGMEKDKEVLNNDNNVCNVQPILYHFWGGNHRNLFRAISEGNVNNVINEVEEFVKDVDQTEISTMTSGNLMDLYKEGHILPCGVNDNLSEYTSFWRNVSDESLDMGKVLAADECLIANHEELSENTIDEAQGTSSQTVFQGVQIAVPLLVDQHEQESSSLGPKPSRDQVAQTASMESHSQDDLCQKTMVQNPPVSLTLDSTSPESQPSQNTAMQAHHQDHLFQRTADYIPNKGHVLSIPKKVEEASSPAQVLLCSRNRNEDETSIPKNLFATVSAAHESEFDNSKESNSVSLDNGVEEVSTTINSENMYYCQDLNSQQDLSDNTREVSEITSKKIEGQNCGKSPDEVEQLADETKSLSADHEPEHLMSLAPLNSPFSTSSNKTSLESTDAAPSSNESKLSLEITVLTSSELMNITKELWMNSKECTQQHDINSPISIGTSEDFEIESSDLCSESANQETLSDKEVEIPVFRSVDDMFKIGQTDWNVADQKQDKPQSKIPRIKSKSLIKKVPLAHLHEKHCHPEQQQFTISPEIPVFRSIDDMFKLGQIEWNVAKQKCKKAQNRTPEIESKATVKEVNPGHQQKHGNCLKHHKLTIPGGENISRMPSSVKASKKTKACELQLPSLSPNVEKTSAPISFLAKCKKKKEKEPVPVKQMFYQEEVPGSNQPEECATTTPRLLHQTHSSMDSLQSDKASVEVKASSWDSSLNLTRKRHQNSVGDLSSEKQRDESEASRSCLNSTSTSKCVSKKHESFKRKEHADKDVYSKSSPSWARKYRLSHSSNKSSVETSSVKKHRSNTKRCSTDADGMQTVQLPKSHKTSDVGNRKRHIKLSLYGPKESSPHDAAETSHRTVGDEHLPNELNISYSPGTISAREKVMRDWNSNYVPTPVKFRRSQSNEHEGRRQSGLSESDSCNSAPLIKPHSPNKNHESAMFKPKKRTQHRPLSLTEMRWKAKKLARIKKSPYEQQDMAFGILKQLKQKRR